MRNLDGDVNTREMNTSTNSITPKQRRLLGVAVIAVLLGGAVALVLGALRENIVFFYTPSEIPADIEGRPVRLGGLVKDGSVSIDGLDSRFVVTDGTAEVSIGITFLLSAKTETPT